VDRDLNRQEHRWRRYRRWGDPVRLEQALLNILRNAMLAIDEAKARQLFTPFFTTRSDRQGIGLTLVREILLARPASD
jgi:C4-dicarboxylate-specific signal transduction histidine kinase